MLLFDQVFFCSFQFLLEIGRNGIITSINPFVFNAPILYPLKTSEKSKSPVITGRDTVIIT